MTRPTNVVVIVSDSHSRNLLGVCGGTPAMMTPNLDALAQRGARFDDAYCTSPICVPSRASLATGQYPHQNRYWENSIALDGRTPTWMMRARDAGHLVAGVGKFHFRNEVDDNGFSESFMPMHIAEGDGELIGLLRSTSEEPVRAGLWDLYTRRSGVGEDTAYQGYDRRITSCAAEWIGTHAKDANPWALCIHYVSAHAPYTVPQDLFDLYPPDAIPLPPGLSNGERPTHPAVEHLRRVLAHKEVDAETIRRLAAGYFATITHLDRQIGVVLAAIKAAGIEDETTIIYTSDHGFSYGQHFVLGLFNLFEPSVGVPLIIAHPNLPRGRVVEEIVSHVDLHPTILECLGVPAAAHDQGLPGSSLLPSIAGVKRERIGFAEYHALGSRAGAFMLRKGNHKLIYHVGMVPQLFDLAADPDELHDLAGEPASQAILADLEGELRRIVDPEQADALAKSDQQRRIAELGGKAAILERRSGFVYSPPPGHDWRTV